MPLVRRAPLFLFLLLVPVATALAANPVEERARAELEKQLAELAPPSPALVEIVLEGLGLPDYTLDAADFQLDGQPLAIARPAELHAKGEHRLFLAPADVGAHTLLVKLVFKNTDAGFFSQLAGYRWKLASSVRFEAKRGLKVRVMVRPAFLPEAPDLAQRFTLSHGVGAEMVAPPAEPALVQVDVAPAKPVVPASAVAGPGGTQPAVIRKSVAALKLQAHAGPRGVAATVRLYGPENRELSLAKGDAEGQLVTVLPGRYVAELVAPGYLSQVRAIELAEGDTQELRFKLSRSPSKKRVFVKEGKLELTPPLQFEIGKSGLNVRSRATLQHVVDAIVLHDIRRLRIEGHTDGREGRGKGRAVAISLARAQEVKEALVAAGVPEERLEVKSMGAARPLAPNVTARGRSYNRRVELVIVGP